MASNYGIKIAPKGHDVFGTEDKDLIFSSKYTTLKVLAKGTTTFTTDGSGNGTRIIPHNLGYAPTFYVFGKGTASWQKENPGGVYSNTYTNAYFPNVEMGNSWSNLAGIQVNSDATNLYISAVGSTATNTTFNFLYYIFVDLAEQYDQISPQGLNNFGIKIAPSGSDVFSNKDFQLDFSSRYKSLRYIPSLSGTATLTLPLIFASKINDPIAEEATYADINHSLGFPPFYLCFYTSDSGSGYPQTSEIAEVGFRTDVSDTVSDKREITSFCDSTKIRITFWRRSFYNFAGTLQSWASSETIKIKYLIFNEDLTDFT